MMGRLLLALLLATAAVLGSVSSAIAFAAHDDPSAAPWIYDGVSVLQKHSEVISYVIIADDDAVAELQDQASYANIPPALSGSVSDFFSSGKSLATAIKNIKSDIAEAGSYLSQFRPAEAGERSESAALGLQQAYAYLATIELSSTQTAGWWNARMANVGSPLRLASDDLDAELMRLRRLLDFLLAQNTALQQQEQSMNIDENAGTLRATELTLIAQPDTAYVGDNVDIGGALTSLGVGLEGKSITILLDGSPAFTVLTALDGSYRGSLSIPYRYVNQMQVEALYIPAGRDLGLYLGSQSQAVKLNILFYQTSLFLQDIGNAYPGRAASAHATLSYDGAPLPAERAVQVQWDGVLFADMKAGESFSFDLPDSAASAHATLSYDGAPLPAERAVQVQWDGVLFADMKAGESFSFDLPDSAVGTHRLAVYVAAQKRYSPASLNRDVSVVNAVTTLRLSTPGMVLLPFGANIKGNASSSFGPLENAKVNIQLGKWESTVLTGPDGSFDARLNTGFSLTLIGGQDLNTSVLPTERWNGAAQRTDRMVVVNLVNLLALLAAMVIVAAYAWRLRRILPRIRPSVPAPESVPLLVPVTPTLQGDGEAQTRRPGVESRQTLAALYGAVLRAILSFTAAVIGPSRTLREVADDLAPKLGPLAGPFRQLTLLLEKDLYSPSRLSDTDTAAGEELGRTITRGVGRANR